MANQSIKKSNKRRFWMAILAMKTGIWSVIWLKCMENGPWPHVISDSEDVFCLFIIPTTLVCVFFGPAIPTSSISNCYLKVIIICRYIFLRFWLKTRFEFWNLYAEMVQGWQILMFYTTTVHVANVCRYKILRFWANLQKYQMLVPAKISHLKVLYLL